ncbi:hypothetical protein H5P28_01435 [Ruficoccus amylovorans]|uniref:Uncharacterized protein n=1 Tax=Ruficoccus amylovorans TaxID=1804625 RepID=A0A842H929_9BACT|nr:hypothetical protein [Ruficoccus amylovorans]MBC2592912.1 hypothetical protein [Ruficoccus amylovorans]
MNERFPFDRTEVLRLGGKARTLCALAALAVLPVVASAASPVTAVATDSTPVGENGVASAGETLIAPGANLGMWVWRAEPLSDPQEREALIAFCRELGISRIFVQVRFDKEAGAYQLSNTEDWVALMAMAREAGISVEALDGAGDMGFAANRADTLARLDAVLAFHAAQPDEAGFSGFHYDIEPYVTKRWKTSDKKQVALELLETMRAIDDKVKAVDPELTITHDIPFWYNGREELAVEFGGSTKFLDEHIQDLSDGIGIMSYRTKMTGGNSVVDISSEELDYARQTGGSVYLSLETVTLDETPSITFHGREGSELIAAVRELNAALAGDPAFAGINLHCYRTLRPMLEPKPPATDSASEG